MNRRQNHLLRSLPSVRHSILTKGPESSEKEDDMDMSIPSTEDTVSDRSNLTKEQDQDPSLQSLRDMADSNENGYRRDDGLLVHDGENELGETRTRIVLPECRRRNALQLAHALFLARWSLWSKEDTCQTQGTLHMAQSGKRSQVIVCYLSFMSNRRKSSYRQSSTDTLAHHLSTIQQDSYGSSGATSKYQTRVQVSAHQDGLRI